MTSTPGPIHLNSHHRDTVSQIFRHPVGHNIEWRDVLSLLEAVGSVEETHHGKFLVTLGDETEPFRAAAAQGYRRAASRRLTANVGQRWLRAGRREWRGRPHPILRSGPRWEGGNPLSVAAEADASCRGQVAAIGELAGELARRSGCSLPSRLVV